MFGRKQHPEATDRLLDKLEQLETRLQRLELDNAERQLAIANAMEKTLRALKAREAKRERENENGGEVPGGMGRVDAEHPAPRSAPSTAFLAARFKRF